MLAQAPCLTLRDWVSFVPSLVEALVEAVSLYENDQHYEMMSGGPENKNAVDGWLWWDVQKSAASEREMLEADSILELVTLWDPSWKLPHHLGIWVIGETMNHQQCQQNNIIFIVDSDAGEATRGNRRGRPEVTQGQVNCHCVAHFHFGCAFPTMLPLSAAAACTHTHTFIVFDTLPSFCTLSTPVAMDSPVFRPLYTAKYTIFKPFCTLVCTCTCTVPLTNHPQLWLQPKGWLHSSIFMHSLAWAIPVCTHKHTCKHPHKHTCKHQAVLMFVIVPPPTPLVKGALAAWPNMQAWCACMHVFVPHKQAVLGHTWTTSLCIQAWPQNGALHHIPSLHLSAHIPFHTHSYRYPVFELSQTADEYTVLLTFLCVCLCLHFPWLSLQPEGLTAWLNECAFACTSHPCSHSKMAPCAHKWHTGKCKGGGGGRLTHPWNGGGQLSLICIYGHPGLVSPRACTWTQFRHSRWCGNVTDTTHPLAHPCQPVATRLLGHKWKKQTTQCWHVNRGNI